MRRSVLVAILLTTSVGIAKDKPPPDGLSPKLRDAIENVETAYAAGDLEKVWKLVSGPANGLKDDLAAKLDDALAARKLPPVRDLLVHARVKLMLEGRSSVLPAPSLKERLLILVALKNQLQNPLDQIADKSLLREDAPPPKNMKQFDKRLHDIEGLRAKLEFARICASYARDLAVKLPAAARKKLTDEQEQTIAAAEGDLLQKVQDAEQQLRELELEIRLLRLRYSVAVLEEKLLTRERFIAAAAARQDARILKQAIEPTAPVFPKGAKGKAAAAKAATTPATPVSFHRQALASPSLANEVGTLSRHAEEWAGPLADKAEGFFAGLDYWLKGRYGWGPDLAGLAKSDAALQDAELLQRVFMPDNLLTFEDEPDAAKPPTPTHRPEGQPTTTTSAPQCRDRRHHYTWAWEDRRLVTTMSSEVQEDATAGLLRLDRSNSGYSGTWTRGFATETMVRVPPQDERLVYRIVGFLEYSHALECLDKFVETASNAELEVATQIIRSQKALRIDTNLSRRIEGQSVLSEQSSNPRDDYKRHGLEWMMALARIEVGAMLAGFTSHSDPFLGLAPKTLRPGQETAVPFGTDAYGELLMDGLRSHYWSIVREDLIGSYYKAGVPENHLLTQSRRGLLGRQFLRAVVRFSGGSENLPSSQRAELQTWDGTFDKLQRTMLYCLTYKVGHTKSVTERFYYAWDVHHNHRPETQAPISTTAEKHDLTPDVIRRVLLQVDPTLAACGCK